MAFRLVGAKHYLNQCWNIVNSNLRKKIKSNLNQNSYIFIQEEAFENVICKKVAILSRPQCVNWLVPNEWVMTQYGVIEHGQHWLMQESV